MVGFLRKPIVRGLFLGNIFPVLHLPELLIHLALAFPPQNLLNTAFLFLRPDYRVVSIA